MTGLLRLGINWAGIGPLSGPGRASTTPQPPVNINAPVISGTPQVGSTLTASHGTYTGAFTGYSGQWYSGASPIALATGLTYVPLIGDLGSLITYRESAYNTDPAYSSTTGSSNALGPVTTVLGTLTFSATTFTVGTSTSGTIIGATATSTITASGLPSGLTINGAARTWAWSGTGTASTGSFTLTETLAGATNTPHNSTISYIISSGAFGGAGTLSAPTIGYPSPLATNPTTISIHVGADWQTGDVLKLARSVSVAISSPTILTHTLTDADITAGTISLGLSGVTLSGATYFAALGSHSGVDSANVSNIVTWGDTTAPTITTSATQTITETSQLAVALTGTDAGGIASWSIVGGVDQLAFQITGSTLQWLSNGSQSYASPIDSDGNNSYVVTVQATDYGGNVSTLTITVSVTAIDQTPDAFSFTNVSSATRSTLYTSNTVTLSGLTPGFNIAASLAGTGFTYSKNGGTYQAAGSFTVQNGDTITLRDTSSASYSTGQSATLTVGTGSATWIVTTQADPANAGFTPSTTQPATTLSVGAASKSYTLDFQAGIAVVYAQMDSGVGTLASVTLDGTSMTSVVSPDTKTAAFILTGVSSGNHTVVVNSSGGNIVNLNVASGTVTNTAATTTSATQSQAWGFHSTTPGTSSLTVGANGIAAIFGVFDSSTLPVVSANSGQTLVANNADTTTHQTQIATATATTTPGFTVTNAGFSAVVALAFAKV